MTGPQRSCTRPGGLVQPPLFAATTDPAPPRWAQRQVPDLPLPPLVLPPPIPDPALAGDEVED